MQRALPARSLHEEALMRKRLLACAALLVAAVFLSHARPAAATQICTYAFAWNNYSDAAKTNLVGECHYASCNRLYQGEQFCTGQAGNYHTTTAYADCLCYIP
jgi:hypothetical protein